MQVGSMRLVLVQLVLVSLILGCKDHNKEKEGDSTVEASTDTARLDKALMDSIQYQTFNYFWEAAEPISGLARERLHMDNVYPTHDKDIITTGGSGFGLMAILMGVERDYITRQQALERYEQIVDFLEKADRFHGAWPHWLYPSGKVAPFSKMDIGGDLVETAFLVQGLLTVREYFKDGNERERQLAQKIQQLWEEVEWDWYTKGGEDVLYWHWSPEYEWQMNFPVGGYNECLIMYILAAASPTHPIEKSVYEKGWARNDSISRDTTYYGLETELDHYEHDDAPVGPMFWAHYSYLGLDPNGLKDQYGDYWKLNVNHALIQYRYAVDNPEGYEGYGEDLWGLTSSYSVKGYAGHRPGNDHGVISPTAALSSMPYTPKESKRFLRYMYSEQDSLIGTYGPYDAFSLEHDWYVPRYLAIDQGTIPVMIENYRTGMFWKLFMANEEVLAGLKKLGFESPYLKNDD